MNKIYYATGNKGKFNEVKIVIDELAPEIELVQYSEDIPEIQSLDQKKVALDKAKKAWAILKAPVIVDDSGMFLEAYNNFPGTLTKFIFQGIGFEGLFKLAEKNNNAAFILNMVYLESPESYKMFEEKCTGKVVDTKREPIKGFPLYPIFIPTGSIKPYADLLGSEELEKYNIRVQAIKSFLRWYKIGNPSLLFADIRHLET